MSRFTLLGAVLLGCLFAPGFAVAETLPTQAEIQQLYGDGKYPLALQRIQRVLLLKGPAAKAYDRHELLRLKGETHLRLKASSPAAQAFEDAAAETTDPATAANDRATALLLKRSQQLTYTPKTKLKGKPAAAISVVEAETRNQALAALFEDEFAADEPKIRAARTASELSAILNIIPVIHDLRTLELASSAKDVRTKELIGELGKHARDLMTEGLKDLDPKVAAVEKSANEIVPVEHLVRDTRVQGGVRTESRLKKRGIEQKESLILEDAYSTCEKVAASCQEMADALGLDSIDFGPIRADAGKLARRADTVLKQDFSTLYVTPPR